MEVSLKKYLGQAKELLDAGCAQEVEFSSRTYQILVTDPTIQESFWVFLQLDKQSQVKDAFCACSSEDEEGACAHLAAAYELIFHGGKIPLHQRFSHSLWGVLMQRLCEDYGNEERILTKDSSESYSLYLPEGDRAFFLKAKNQEGIEWLAKHCEERPLETEENSIKFSDLSQEELEHWHEGRPSLTLRYELSFWADLAKFLFLQQESSTPFSIDFSYDEEGVPLSLSFSFSSLEGECKLSRKVLEEIIPFLGSIRSPLKVFGLFEENIEALSYDKKEKKFQVKWKEEGEGNPCLQNPCKCISIGEWSLIPGRGFYQEKNSIFLEEDFIAQENIPRFFDEHLVLLEKFLLEETLHKRTLRPSYTIYFDESWQLHIEMFLFRPQDLEVGDSCCFGEWVFLDGKGFYRVEDPLFPRSETIISEREVSDFVHHHRAWLNTHRGFMTHLANIDAHLSYHFDPKRGLSFSAKAELFEDHEDTHDFGDWIYIRGEGFYSKSHKSSGILLWSGLEIETKKIPVFIRINRDELEYVEHFFCPEDPFLQVGLEVNLLASGGVEVKPYFITKREYRRKKVLIWENIAHIEGEGFFILPPGKSLPESYRKPVTVAPKDLHWFLSCELDRIHKFIAKLDPKLKRPSEFHISIKKLHKKQLKERARWTLQLGIQTELGEVKLGEFCKGIEKKERYIFTKAGLIDTSHEKLKWIQTIPAKQLKPGKNEVEMTTLELLRFYFLERPQEKCRDEKSQLLLRGLLSFHVEEDLSLEGFSCTLRPYQSLGLQWLWFLYNFHLSGLLCDDMGLGKTHQTMALFAAARNKFSKEHLKQKFLVVCPTSVIYHWQEKLKSFLPQLKVYTYYREQRDLDLFQAEYDILLTSYGLYRFDQKKLSHLEFDIAVFDEVQLAKNAQSQTFQVLSKVKTHMSLGLTGTPIENNLRELKTLFDLVLPTYMPGEKAYRDFFIFPIERDGDEMRQAQLARFIAPFVLRRNKRDVLDDLPEKTEEKAFCVCTEEQSQLYRDLLHGKREELFSELQENKEKVSYVHIFALLTKLKQICNHPALIHKDVENFEKYRSGKWELFVELIKQARESRQKVVVFSQFLDMIAIIERYCRQEDIGFCSLKGDTRNREEQLKRFSTDPKAEIFICSLKAGGLGIDLTPASVVIHYDRWWNAARENQATDRVHRLGQSRGVQVFKLITKQTLEERIDSIIEEKGKLMEEIVQKQDKEVMLDRQDILSLLQMVPTL